MLPSSSNYRDKEEQSNINFFKFGLSRPKMGGEWVLQRETFLQTLEIQKVVKGEKMLILWPDGNQLAYYSYLELFVLVCFQFKKGL